MSKEIDGFKKLMSYEINRNILKAIKNLNTLYGYRKTMAFLKGIPNTLFIRTRDIDHPYFGILEFMDKIVLEQAFKQLIDIGFIEIINVNGKFSVYESYKVSEAGERHLNKDLCITIFSDKENYSKELFKDIRRIIHKIKQRKSLAHIIVSNTVVKNICLYLPKTKEEFLQINGLGNFFIEYFYSDVKKVIISHTQHLEN